MSATKSARTGGPAVPKSHAKVASRACGGGATGEGGAGGCPWCVGGGAIGCWEGGTPDGKVALLEGDGSGGEGESGGVAEIVGVSGNGSGECNAGGGVDGVPGACGACGASDGKAGIGGAEGGGEHGGTTGGGGEGIPGVQLSRLLAALQSRLVRTETELRPITGGPAPVGSNTTTPNVDASSHRPS